MSNKVFAVIGIDDIGTHLVNGFVAKGVTPVILTRKSSNTNFATKFPDTSLAMVRVESYENVDEVAKTLKENNIEVVCTLANAVLALQYPLSEAAKQTGVKLNWTGSFFGYLSFFTGQDENGKVNVLGKGDKPVSFTDEADIGGLTAHVLTALPPKELENRCFCIEGDHATVVEMGKEARQGDRLYQSCTR
ncbi:hypothetical protein AAF712_007428 [Marasmius tenuissimus]|uniref:Uncharacterized protein n=1 Tax=Marasmius tenuissimus TaxID=585030 RepID=A0ABR2ZVY3_9AGAR